MDKKSLRKLSKNELIRIILEQVADSKKITDYLNFLDNPHTPSSKKRSKKNTERDESQPRNPGKPKGSNGGGIHIPPPDKEEPITQENCNHCGSILNEPYDSYSFCQMDIPSPKFITTRYNVNLYKCNDCGCDIDAGLHLSKNFYGPNITALIGCLKDECLSYDAISRLFKDMYKLPISSVSVFNKITQLSLLMAQERERIRQTINRSNHANMDETGIRLDGKNSQVWNLSTPTHCLFEFDPSRGAAVAQRLLQNFNGALVTDDFKSYRWHELHQLCWAHLLRHAKDYAKKYDGATAQYQRLKILYDKAKRAQQSNNKGAYEELSSELEDIARCYHPLDGCKNMHAMIHNRTELWLLGVKLPYVPLTNNRAERSLRRVVLHRNRMGCIRNEKGQAFINNFLTCTATWKINEKSVYQKLLNYALLT